MDEKENSSSTMNEPANVFPIAADIPQQNPPTQTQTDIPESSNPSSSSSSGAGPSEIKPWKEVDGFRIEVKPASLLKLAMDAASDAFFNPSGLGRVDTHDTFVGITIASRDNLSGCLVLSEFTAVHYHCNRTVFVEMVDVRDIRHGLSRANDEDIVSVVYVHESNEITFTFRKDPIRIFAIPFLQDVDEIPEFPHGSRMYHIVVNSDKFRALIEEELVKNGVPQLVKVDLRTTSSRVAIGEQTITNDYPYTGPDEKVLHASFYWPYPQVLKKATRLSAVSVVCFTGEPSKHVLMHFGLPGLLIFIKEADKMIVYLGEEYL